MSFLQKTKAFLGFDEELVEHFPQTRQTQTRRAPAAAPQRPMQRPAGKLLSFPQQKAQRSSGATAQDVVILAPQAFEDSLTVSTYLKNGHPVIVNIKNLDNASGKRFIDFVCGSAYIFDGGMHPLGGTIFLFTPTHMGIIPAENITAPAHRQPSQTEEELVQLEDEMPEFDQPVATNDDGFEYFDPMQEEEQLAQPYYATAR